MIQVILAVLLAAQTLAAPAIRNTWPAEYAKKDAAAFAAEFEEPSRALFRYRAAMAGLIPVKPGMKVGEVGAGSGYLSRYIAEKVGPDGHVYANELEGKMVAYMNDRAAKEGLKNFTALKGTATSTGFQPESLDAVTVVYAFSFFDEREAMLKSIHASLKPDGVLLIVDLPSEQVGTRMMGIDAEDVIALAAAAGLTRDRENGIIPGHYGLIFRKKLWRGINPRRTLRRIEVFMNYIAGIFLFVTIGLTAAASPAPELTWPGFRGHEMSGVAPKATLPDQWSTTRNVKWSAPIAGNGWSSPIVWGDTVYVTTAIGAKEFKKPSTGLFGNDYVAELQAQGLTGDELIKKVQERDNETPAEASELRYMLYAIDVATGKTKWEREAVKMVPGGGRHRKNTFASETPFTDGERLYVSFGQNVGLFVFTMDGKPLWKKQWTPQPIYLDFGTASSPVVHDGRVYLVHDSEQLSYITALDAKTGDELWRTERPATGQPKSSWMTPFIWKHSGRTEIVTTGHGFVISYGLDGQELWRISGMAMPTASALAWDGMLYVGTGSQGDANRPFMAVKPGAAGDITLKPDTTSNEFVMWRQGRVAGYTPSAIVHAGKAYLVHDTGILTVLDAKSGKQVYKVRVGGGGQTFSASPVAAGSRIYFLSEDGVTFVLDTGDVYREVAKNELGELALSSPAIAGNALYIRTQSKLYKIAN